MKLGIMSQVRSLSAGAKILASALILFGASNSSAGLAMEPASCDPSKSELNVEFDVKVHPGSEGVYWPVVKTNLPEGTKLLVSVYRGDQLIGSQVGLVEPSGELGVGGMRLSKGDYELLVQGQMGEQEGPVLQVLGEGGSNICGPEVKEFLGERVVAGKFSVGIK